MKKNSNSQNGQLALSVAIMIMVFSVIGVTSSITMSREIKKSTLDTEGLESLSQAEGKIEHTMAERTNTNQDQEENGFFKSLFKFKKEEAIEHYMKKGEVLYLTLEELNNNFQCSDSKTCKCNLEISWDQINNDDANSTKLWANFYTVYKTGGTPTNPKTKVINFQRVLAPKESNYDKRFDVAKNGRDLKNQQTVTLDNTRNSSDGGWVGIQFVKLTNLERDTKIEIGGSCKPQMFQSQATTAKNDELGRNLQVKETYPVLPNFFDFALYTNEVKIN